MESLYLSLPCGIALHGSAATYLSLLSCRTLELFLAFHAHREGALIIELCVFWETQVLVFLRCSWGDPLGPRGGGECVQLGRVPTDTIPDGGVSVLRCRRPCVGAAPSLLLLLSCVGLDLQEVQTLVL